MSDAWIVLDLAELAHVWCGKYYRQSDWLSTLCTCGSVYVGPFLIGPHLAFIVASHSLCLLIHTARLKPFSCRWFRDRDTAPSSSSCAACRHVTRRSFHAASKLMLEYIAHSVQYYVYNSARVTDVPNNWGEPERAPHSGSPHIHEKGVHELYITRAPPIWETQSVHFLIIGPGLLLKDIKAWDQQC